MKSSVFCLAFLLTVFVGVSIAGEDDELCACTALWAPVCGVDGKTYSNDGCAACAGVKIDCEGECPCRQCRCPVSNTPVCGNDGKDYPNACEANCKGVGVACESRCPCPCICIALYDPVCGTDGVTYGNSCEAGCKGVKIACEQECPCPSDDCFCTKEYNPVCGTDQKTYGNPCMARCAGVKIACSGECPCKPDVGCVCPEIFAPVCGVDGVTYDNDCFAGCAKIPVDCQGKCPCPCSKGVAACKADPCDVETCPAFPDAKCFSNFCGGCNAIFVKDGKIVDCKVPSPSLPPHNCVPKDKRCNAFRTTFPSEFGRERKCCPGLECCPRCRRTHDSSLTVAPVHGTCKTHCPDCK